jgi:ketosteroid isomerase-like protein
VTDPDLEVLREAFRRWSRADVEGTLELMAEDVRWYPAATAPDIDSEYRGWDGVRRFFTDFREPWEWIEMEPLEMVRVGAEVVVRVRFQAEGREGMRVDMEFGQRYHVRDGLLVQFDGYASFDEALEAALRA